MLKMLKKLIGKNVEYATPLEKAYQRAVNEIYYAKQNGQSNLLFHHYDATTTDKMVEMLNEKETESEKQHLLMIASIYAFIKANC
jgi:hypothetical protein